jgi:hypothetical protein
MFACMDSENLFVDHDKSGTPGRTGNRDRMPAWAMATLIELLDRAIDSAGMQLARSAGLWDDTPAERVARTKPCRRSRQEERGSHVDQLLEECAATREPELP